MSSIDKMAIKGIRSFDNHQNETIQFFSPLTLIVGHNGSGKTTIIESLRYATTGSTPPNTKGGAFLHDPDICGEREVLAQIKLSFNNTNGEKMICTRSLQLSVNAGKRSQKKLDGTLTVLSNGERSTISTRCADLDLQMPISLGVSKSVLEFVIFCHQEDSTWPLSDSKTLKTRFDDIFEAVKYTKALDQIKNVRKEQMTEVRIQSVQLETLKTNKEHANQSQAEVEDLLAQIASSKDRIRSLDEQMAEALEEQNDLFRFGEEFERIIAELDKFRHEKRILRETHDELSRNIVEYAESSESLLEMQTNFASTMAKQERVIEDLKGQEAIGVKELVQMRAEINNRMTRLGQLQSEADQFERQLLKREEMVKTIAKTNNVRGFDMSLDENQIQDFKAKLDQLVKAQTHKVERLRDEGRKQESEANLELQAIMARHAEYEGQNHSARAIIKADDARAVDLQGQLGRNVAAGNEVVILGDELSQVESEISQAQKKLDKDNYDSQLRENAKCTRNLEDQIDDLDRELKLGNRQADTRAKLGLLKLEVKRSTDNIESLISLNKISFQEVVRMDPNADTFDQDVRQVTAANEIELEEAYKDRTIAHKEVSQLEAQVNVYREQLRNKRREENQLKEQISAVFSDPDTAETDINSIEKELEQAQANYYQAQYAVKFYDRAVSFAQANDCCQLCNQRFHEDFSLDEFLSLIGQKKSAVPKHLAKAQEVIDICNQDLEQARTILPARTQLTSLRAELPSIEQRLNSSQDVLVKAISAAELATNRTHELESKAKTIRNLDRVGSDILRSKRDVLDAQKRITNLEVELQSSGTKRSMDEMQADLQTLQDDLKRLRKESSAVKEDRDRQVASLQTLNNKRRDIQLQQSELQGRLRDRENINARLLECQASISRCREEIRSNDEKQQKDLPMLEHLRGKFETLRSQNNLAETQAQKDLSRLVASQNSLLGTDADIDAYIQSDGPNNLKVARTELNQKQLDVRNAEAKAAVLASEIETMQLKSTDLQSTERNISDNLRLRKIDDDIVNLSKNIEELEDRNAERDRDQYIIDSRQLKDRYSRLIVERAQIVGSVTEKDSSLKKAQMKLETEYKDADEIHRKMLIKVRTMEKANEDLDKYGKALDSAIMKYHSLKMEEINKIIDELWKATYCGTDVDTILIKSEGEQLAANRTYNYRVCMVKGEAELDMRGRCSAGQKVLAAIIIRLALAECFGVNCGILALDEPTTNLDRENIESLAKSLANIIAARRSQKNFQLIVITHDEEFLRMMGCSDYCDFYYRVSRNEHQKSEITMQRVSTVL